jgi:hypothetical protein
VIIAVIGRIKISDVKRILIGDVSKIDAALIKGKLHTGREPNDRTVSVSGAIAATNRIEPGGILGEQDATGGTAAVVKIHGEQAEIRAVYDDHGRVTKIEIIAIN